MSSWLALKSLQRDAIGKDSPKCLFVFCSSEEWTQREGRDDLSESCYYCLASLVGVDESQHCSVRVTCHALQINIDPKQCVEGSHPARSVWNLSFINSNEPATQLNRYLSLCCLHINTEGRDEDLLKAGQGRWSIQRSLHCHKAAGSGDLWEEVSCGF